MILTLICLLAYSISNPGPVSWVTSFQKNSELEYTLIFSAKINDGWNIYSQYLANDEGPIRTSINYNSQKHFELIGKNEESGVIKKGNDEMFGMEVIKISKQATFKQKIKIKDINIPIEGYIEFMCCNDQQCLPPKQIKFNLNLNSVH